MVIDVTSLRGVSALVVEDDAIVRTILMAHLRAEGASPIGVATVAEAVAAYRQRSFEVVIVDVNLPDGLGYDLLRTLQRIRDCASLMLTSRGETADRVRGLASGADDYLVKPAELAELSARIKAILRRHRRTSAAVIPLAGWTLDLLRRELADDHGQPVPMTRGEFDLFCALVQASPTPLGRDYLLEVVSSVDTPANIRTIDVMVSRIRAKLMPARALRVVTVRGDGYRFEQDTT